MRNLFQGYQHWIRPIQHANDTVTVRFGFKISQLVDVVRILYAGAGTNAQMLNAHMLNTHSG